MFSYAWFCSMVIFPPPPSSAERSALAHQRPRWLLQLLLWLSGLFRCHTFTVSTFSPCGGDSYSVRADEGEGLLCPHACLSSPGKASYSAFTAIFLPPPLAENSARNAVFKPCAWRVTTKSSFSKMEVKKSCALCSSWRSSGFVYMYWFRAFRESFSSSIWDDMKLYIRSLAGALRLMFLRN
ncbi:unnamed protein product [Tuber aestivum]|uniref:Uncharacterized protein n=1 Tax=Tuber aestivum TaxID=59557 RepID=A0A292Q523_9PEZI|nr:unnamed protein product [Tuber aestivum]